MDEGLATELANLEERIANTEVQLVRLEAELAGLRATRDSIARAVATSAEAAAPPMAAVPDLARLDRTEAIEKLLGLAARSLSIGEVWDGLRAGGREEPTYQVIASTLNFLHREGRIRRTGRGRYAA
jgi:hypothetical protein